ncbi:MAG: guanylate cyclase, partial [Bacteroidota bacterium]|nr:guanylate cyclase [Bacteroidota bacterium]
DAFSAYMGRVDFYFQSENLFRELYERSQIGSRRSWNKILIQQLNGLCFYTKAAQKLQEVSPEEQIEKMKKL